MFVATLASFANAQRQTTAQHCTFDSQCRNCDTNTLAKRCGNGGCVCLKPMPTDKECMFDAQCPMCNDLTLSTKRCDSSTNKCTCLHSAAFEKCLYNMDCPNCDDAHLVKRCLNRRCECIQRTCKKYSDCPQCHGPNSRKRCSHNLCYC